MFFYNAPTGYDMALSDLDYTLRGTISIGEVVTASIALAGDYNKPVMVVTGQEDNLFCNPTGTVLTHGDCGGADLLPRFVSWADCRTPDAVKEYTKCLLNYTNL